MKKILPAFLAAFLMIPSFASASRIIYGDDDRQDYSDSSADMQKLADSVVSIWDKDYMKSQNGQTFLFTVPFEKGVGLCPGEVFGQQPIGAFCSGTLVGDDLILTAGHCITDEASCAKARFVFGFNDKAAANAKLVDQENQISVVPVKDSDVYSCSSIVKRNLGKQHNGTVGMIWDYIMYKHDRVAPDYALIKLDRKVKGHTPLPVERTKNLNEGDSIFVIGHPVGLPVKVAGGATIRNNKPKNFYLTDLDTFGGNSGSAVFSSATNKIVGILVRGSTDFVDAPDGRSCKIQNRVPQDYGKGEAVNRLAPVLKYIPEAGKDKAAAQETVKVPAPKLDNTGKADTKIKIAF